MATLEVAMGRLVARCKAASGQDASPQDGEAATIAGDTIALLLSGLPSEPQAVYETVLRRTFMAVDALGDGNDVREVIAGAIVEGLLLGWFMGQEP